jgi:hypothetical protein
VHWVEEDAPLQAMALPAPPYFERSARGVTEAEIAPYRKTRKASELTLVAPRESAWSLGRRFDALVSELARELGALVWERETRVLYSPDAWARARVLRWERDGIPTSRITS